MIGDSKKAQDLAKALFNEGVFTIPIVYPMVPKDKARIRTIINAKHSLSDLDFALERLENVGKKMNII